MLITRKLRRIIPAYGAGSFPVSPWRRERDVRWKLKDFDKRLLLQNTEEALRRAETLQNSLLFERPTRRRRTANPLEVDNPGNTRKIQFLDASGARATAGSRSSSWNTVFDICVHRSYLRTAHLLNLLLRSMRPVHMFVHIWRHEIRSCWNSMHMHVKYCFGNACNTCDSVRYTSSSHRSECKMSCA